MLNIQMYSFRGLKTHVILSSGVCKWGSEQQLMTPYLWLPLPLPASASPIRACRLCVPKSLILTQARCLRALGIVRLIFPFGLCQDCGRPKNPEEIIYTRYSSNTPPPNAPPHPTNPTWWGGR